MSRIDFTGTSESGAHNFNAPRAVTVASQIPPVFTNSGYSGGKSGNTDGNYAFPIEALRMSTSALSSGFLEFSWKQSSIIGN